MLHVTVAFWTNGIPDSIKAQTQWEIAHESGEVYITANNEMGVKTDGPRFFKCLEDIPGVIAMAMIDAGVLLLPNEKAEKNKKAA